MLSSPSSARCAMPRSRPRRQWATMTTMEMPAMTTLQPNKEPESKQLHCQNNQSTSPNADSK